MTAILEIAKSYAKSGLSVIPIRTDKSKAPASKLEPYFKKIATSQELVRMFSSAVGIGIIGGKVSGNLEIMDFDQDGIFDKWLSALADIDQDARKLVESLPHIKTPSLGDHLFYRCSTISSAVKLAFSKQKFTDCTGKLKEALIETKGEGGYVVTAPSPASCHAANKEYKWIGGAKLIEIPTITPKQRAILWEVARSFNERENNKTIEISNNCSDNRPGDDFNNRGSSWIDILVPHGWEVVRTRGDTTYWRRPGKKDGISATTGHCGDKLHVFSSNASPFEDGHTYSKFAAFTELNHKGDYKASTRRLGQDGYGEQKNSKSDINKPVQLNNQNNKIPDGRRPAVIDMGKVDVKPLLWLWPGYMPLGKLCLLDGDPCLGKSMTTLDLAARVTTGRPMPDDSTGDVGGAAGVVLMSCEDDAADTIKPRLIAANANCDLIRLVTGVKETKTLDNGEQKTILKTPTLEDVDILRMVIDEIKAKLVIIDPLMAYMKGDTHRDSDARQGLAPLQKLAEDCSCTVLVVRHLNKSGSGNALYRGGGSIGIIGAARAGLLVAKDPDDKTGKRRIMARTKANLAAEIDTSLVYEIVNSGSSARVEWLGTSKHTATTVLSVPDDDESKSELDEACEWLADKLKNGQQSQTDLLKSSRSEAGISERTLRRAKTRLKIKSSKGLKAWYWELPETVKMANPPNSLSLGHLENNPRSFLKKTNNNNNIGQGGQGGQDGQESVLGGSLAMLNYNSALARQKIQETLKKTSNSKEIVKRFLEMAEDAMKTKDMEALNGSCDWYYKHVEDVTYEF